MPRAARRPLIVAALVLAGCGAGSIATDEHPIPTDPTTVPTDARIMRELDVAISSTGIEILGTSEDGLAPAGAPQNPKLQWQLLDEGGQPLAVGTAEAPG